MNCIIITSKSQEGKWKTKTVMKLIRKLLKSTFLKDWCPSLKNPDNFENIVLSARCGIEQLAKKLDNITDRLVEIDKRLDDPQAMVINILRKVPAGEISEDLGASMLRLTEDSRQRST